MQYQEKKHAETALSYYLFILILLLFQCNSLTAQHRTNVVLKNVKGHHIKGAKVTLIGIDLKPIKAKYDKKGEFYYFNQVPKGYYTVLAEHSEYNPKGYQQVKGLPKQINLELFNPYRLQIPTDTTNYYMEDPYKLVVATMVSSPELNSLIGNDDAFNNKYLELKQQMKTRIDSLSHELGLTRINNHRAFAHDLYRNDDTYIFIKKNGEKFPRYFAREIRAFENLSSVYYVGFMMYLTGRGDSHYLDLKGNFAKNIVCNSYGKNVNKISKVNFQSTILEFHEKPTQSTNSAPYMPTLTEPLSSIILVTKYLNIIRMNIDPSKGRYKDTALVYEGELGNDRKRFISLPFHDYQSILLQYKLEESQDADIIRITSKGGFMGLGNNDSVPISIQKLNLTLIPLYTFPFLDD